MNPTYNRYLEEEVLNADPLKLVQMLYRGAVDAVAAARHHVALKNIRARSNAITRAMEIINYLMFTLNHAGGGEISRNLGSLYAYMQTKLLEANSRQSEQPLIEVDRLLSTLLEGWNTVTPSTAAVAPANEYQPVSQTY